MRAFEVFLNGKKLCLAGIGDDGVLSAIVNWVVGDQTADLFLEVGGLVSPVREHVKWVKQKPLRVGDEIRVKIVETSSTDRPIKKHRIDPAKELRSQKRYVRMMAKNLGWTIQAQPKRKPSA
jgi:hypothetical protein